MSFTLSRFPVQINKEAEALSFGLRASAADYIRGEYRRKLAGGLSAGANKMEIMQKFGLLWAQARHSFKNLRDIPASLLNWAGYVEYHAEAAGFPQPASATIGTFSKDVLTVLPAGVAAIRLAGMNFTGLVPEDQPIRLHEVTEIRVARTNGETFEAVVVMGRPEDDHEGVSTPVPGEPAEVE